MTAVASLGRRVLRSSAITLSGYVAGQALRLAANLILTRLLFPEAFGMMALINVFLMGLVMLSDIGVGPSIMQSKRGDDPAFLDTVWTIQILRGGFLWLLAMAATPLVAWFYKEPDLLSYLPVATISLLVVAFNPTRQQTANRHLRAGLVTLIDFGAQLCGVLITILLAWMMRSTWALVIGGLAAPLVQLALLQFLPGDRNRFRWEKAAAAEVIHFGKWIFLATICGFVIAQADKVILGHFLDLGHFGLYNIAYFLATVPLMVGGVVTGRVLIPVYRDSPPAQSPANEQRVRRFRSGALAALLLISALFAFGGAELVRLMYDERYHQAAGIVVLVTVAQLPSLIFLTCDQAALAMGDSRRFFVLTLARGALVTLGLMIGFNVAGLAGAIVGQGLGSLAAYPVLAWLLKPHGAWNPDLDAQFLAAAVVLGATALWLNRASLNAIPL
ncbi:polysaccharide biosynthesis protein [Rubellimicrobium rubrum]|uniref:Polysaccharide biosynthesis protein n=1 Tax=Rubellimicrobium rubrum TaxID=2585369 RepID=A0A5C4MWB8_9RHOB|nr:oligosaccharide flippase family protein [Rubellimicrobium rubrum]TNC50406.1 polysaccharide biosynthesis protein [Rubellimicrobium rubrum]